VRDSTSRRISVVSILVFFAFLSYAGEEEGGPKSTDPDGEATVPWELKGRLSWTATPYWWSNVVLRLQDRQGQEVARTRVDERGFFSIGIPEGVELAGTVADGDGNPLAEGGMQYDERGILSFAPLPSVAVPLWVDGPEEGGLAFRLKQPAASMESPHFLVVHLCTSAESFLQGPAAEYFKNIPATFLRPVLEGKAHLDLDTSRTLGLLCEEILKTHEVNAARSLLLAEGAWSDDALLLASTQRDRFGAVVLWEGKPCSPVGANLKNTPVAVLGRREDLKDLTEWAERRESESSPVLVRSYWSEPSSFELEREVSEALDWVCSSKERTTERAIEHSTYLPDFGRYQWIWIAELDRPGTLGWVKGEWTPGSLINLETSGVSRLRLNLDSGIGRIGQHVVIRLDSLALPVTLGRNLKSIQLKKKPGEKIWDFTFEDFDSPVPPVVVAQIPPPGFEVGAEIASFARFVRTETSCDCAYGYKWNDSVRPGMLTDRMLYDKVPPTPYVRVVWTPEEINRFHDWRQRKENMTVEISGFQPSSPESGQSPSNRSLTCAVLLPVLSEYVASASDSPETLGEPLSLNLQELVGQFLKKQYR